MKVLVVCSRRYYAPYTDYVAPFIYEQVEALRARGVECEYYLIAGGWRGYLKALCGIRKASKTFQPDIIHAHSGLCNLVAVLSLLTHNSKRHSTNPQHSTKIVATFHGSDVNARSVRWLSKIAMRLADYNIFVSEQLRHIAGDVAGSAVIPCSVDTTFFHAMDKAECRQLLGWEQDKTYILFSKEFADRVKNYPLAKAAVEKISPLYEGVGGVELIELYGYNRQQMVWLYNACDCGLMTSFTEGSPQFIKEAVACGCPIVSTDVGDVREVIEGVPNARICRYDAADVAAQLQEAMAVGHLKQPALAERYTKDVIIDNLLKIYNSL